MKVIIDGKEERFIQIIVAGNTIQCVTQGYKTAHRFNQDPNRFPKNTYIHTNGHIYFFPKEVLWTTHQH